MDASKILADVMLVLSVAKQTFDIGLDGKPFLAEAYQIGVKGEPLSEAVRTAMQAREAALRNQVDAAIAADDAAG